MHFRCRKHFSKIMIRIEFSKILLGYKTTYSKRYVHDFSASGKQYGALSEHHSDLCILANFVTFATHPNGIHHVSHCLGQGFQSEEV